MTQRTLAALLAVPLVVALLVAAARTPLPYVTYEPGLTVDVLGEDGGSEIVEIDGEQTYRDDGELRMTTVFVSRPNAEVSLFEVLGDWLSDEDAVYPYDAVYEQGTTDEQNREEGAVDMVTSQDVATAVALQELGYDVEPAVEVLLVSKDTPADGKLQTGDVFLEANGTEIEEPQDLVDAVQATPEGEPVTFRVLRKGEERTVEVVPELVDGTPQVGVRLGTGYTFPFEVEVKVDPAIGGPSAGLMFSLGIYDTLTEGSLTGGKTVAGTGTIDPEGKVGPIGGIQQKIVGARDAGAELFLVPPDNCADALGAPNEDMRLVRAETMHDAVEAIEAWVKDPDAKLPSCED
ncbi:PDZ domain-containing protein [Nocardioides marmotae]|uniref:endopeptidase La n=1 Tax=Nocardioides marmotae TaxID=2663857 RepID=A0A6I3J8W2_9ACTN|nr:PDZ domain-containing protein [Nocardioides marmotae]MCR6031530.1 PDZ domain-containing protein [Gordonia jinghuaiqii]MBC9733312.1 PDZ domain-containing protein [Nocardioides marmotae]MTB84421.1 PDZ domain-containing protein [Nocardioides marmotae]MTB95169.1 PDZ domain-containing protein [Nocardioides marmotae]QKE02343.1 PDZ domain-containing protein [Nocardioides marmotae]